MELNIVLSFWLLKLLGEAYEFSYETNDRADFFNKHAGSIKNLEDMKTFM